MLVSRDAQSIHSEVKIDVYASNRTLGVAPSGTIVVSNVTASKSALEKYTTFELPTHFYAKLTQDHLDVRTLVSSNNTVKLEAH